MKKFKLVTWNVNSIRIRMELLKKLVELENPEVVCLQEVKAKEADFPFDEVKALGFEHIALYGMPGYNGVAILSKTPISNVEQQNWVGKFDARHIKVSVYDDLEINNIYIPAGGDIPDPIVNLSFAHKLTFMDDISEYYENNRSEFMNKKMILCGDFNVSPYDNDVWNHKQLSKIVSHTPIEIDRLNRLKNSLGFIDVMREYYPETEKVYSWWSYRNPNWQTNDKGRRLDHIWVSPNLKDRMISIRALRDVRTWERPSDHVPVVMEIKLPD